LAVPKGLSAQAQACAVVAARAAGFFKAPSEANVFSVHEAQLQSRREAAQAAADLKTELEPRRGDWSMLSLRLAEASAATAAAAEESERFGAAATEGLADAAVRLRDAGRELDAALSAWSKKPRAEAHVINAKRLAAEAQRRLGGAQAASLDDPNVVNDLKIRTALRRWSQAAESWQGAADATAALLGA
jgi:hypothetical protein